MLAYYILEHDVEAVSHAELKRLTDDYFGLYSMQLDLNVLVAQLSEAKILYEVDGNVGFR